MGSIRIDCYSLIAQPHVGWVVADDKMPYVEVSIEGSIKARLVFSQR